MGADIPAFPGLVAAGQRAGLALEAVADFLAVRADDLAVVIQAESGWDPTAENPSTHAAGLIQWMPATAVRLGMASTEAAAPAAIKALDAERQLYLLPDYFHAALAGRNPATFPSAADTGQIDLGDLYLLIFAPSFAGRTSGTIFPAESPGAASNPGLRAPDGSITVESVREHIEAVSARSDSLPRIATDTWQAPPPYTPRDPRPVVPPAPATPPKKKDEPGIGWLLVALLVGAVAIAARKRKAASSRAPA